jgi:hypothetical protein
LLNSNYMAVAHHILFCDDDRFRMQNLNLVDATVEHLKLVVLVDAVPLYICIHYYYNSSYKVVRRYKELSCVYIGRSFVTSIDQCAEA